MKKTALSIFAAALLIGCGSSSSSNDSGSSTTETETYSMDVTVERGPVIGSYVVDDNGVRARNMGGGVYRFDSEPTYPISAYGGYIDVNRDGVIDASDTEFNIPMSLHEHSRTKLTILTTLAQDESLKNELLTLTGLSEEDLFTLTPSESLEVSAVSDTLFKYCIENNISLENIDLTALQNLNADMQLSIANNYQMGNQYQVAEVARLNEETLVAELNITLGEDVNITLISSTIDHSSQQQDHSLMLDSFPTYELTEKQKEDLVFMYQEEKVARDVYLEMYDMWGLSVFANIAKAEQTHMDSVKALLEKYEIPVPALSDTRGEFDLEELQSLYDTLMTMGSVSSTEALNVGVLVEETDIADLEERIIDAPDDIQAVYQSLLTGSYNHLNAFSSGGTGSGNSRRP